MPDDPNAPSYDYLPRRKGPQVVSRTKEAEQKPERTHSDEEVKLWSQRHAAKEMDRQQSEMGEIGKQFDQRKEEITKSYEKDVEQTNQQFDPRRKEIEKRQSLDGNEGKAYQQSEQSHEDRKIMSDHKKKLDDMEVSHNGQLEGLKDARENQESQLEKRHEKEWKNINGEISKAEEFGRIPAHKSIANDFQRTAQDRGGHER